MEKKKRLGIVFIIFTCLCVGLAGTACQKKAPETPALGPEAGLTGESQEQAAGKPGPAGIETPAIQETEIGKSEKPSYGTGTFTEAGQSAELAARQAFVNEKVYFDFDDASLRPDAIEVLLKKVEWLKKHPDVHVIIEGHCDERGTNEYNLALGSRRAESVKNFLIKSGISPVRLFTISYGEERPVDPGHNEAAWAKNRRVEFKIR